jgi:hypothetical protein
MGLEEEDGRMLTEIAVEVDVKMKENMPMPWWPFWGLECVKAASGLSFH